MKITYKFATGETSVVDVTDEVGEIIMETRRKEHADNVKAGRHTGIWIDALDYEGEDLADEATPETLLMDRIDEEMKRKHFYEVFDRLTPTQRERVLLKAKGLSNVEIARQLGCDESAVRRSLKEVKTFFEKNY